MFRAEWHSSTVAVKMLKRSDSIAMHDFRSELDVLQKARRPHTNTHRPPAWQQLCIHTNQKSCGRTDSSPLTD